MMVRLGDAGKGLVAVGLAVVAGLALGPSAAAAATITADTTADEFGTGSQCSLREAVQASNTDAPFGGCPAGAGADTVLLGSGQTYLLTLPGSDDTNAGGDIDLNSPLTLGVTAGRGAVLTPSLGTDRALDVKAAAAVSRLVVSGADDAEFGAGIRVLGASASLVLSESTVAGNQSEASAGSEGGGLAISGGADATLTNVTVSGNSAVGDGGGLAAFSAGTTVTLANVTVAGNVADVDDQGGGDGGGFLVASGAVVNLRDTVVADNSDLSTSSLVANDCMGGPASLGHNVVESIANCGYTVAGGDLANVDPSLGALADNGGTTLTRALLPGSPALDRGGPSCEANDQRGAPRKRCDIGAYELRRCGGTIVNHVGTAGPDTLRGTAGADGVLALGGRDLLRGLGGRDGLCGEGGKDRLLGGKGRDRLLGQGPGPALRRQRRRHVQRRRRPRPSLRLRAPARHPLRNRVPWEPRGRPGWPAQTVRSGTVTCPSATSQSIVRRKVSSTGV